MMHELDELLQHAGVNDVLLHAGIKGMKWGFNDGERNGKRTADEKEIDELAEKYDLSPKDAKDLAKYIKGKKLTPKQIADAVAFTKALRNDKNKALMSEMKFRAAEAKISNKNAINKYDQMKKDDQIRKAAKSAANDFKKEQESKTVLGRLKAKLKPNPEPKNDKSNPKPRTIQKSSSPKTSSKKKTMADWAGTSFVAGSKEEKEFNKWIKDNGLKKTNLVDKTSKKYKNIKVTTTDITINGKPVKSQSSDKIINDFIKKKKR